MQKLLSLIILSSVLLLTPFVAPAELLIYKGSARFKITGEGLARSVGLKAMLVFDHQATQAVLIVYGTINGFKFYATDSATNLNVIQATGKLGKGYTALTERRTQCDLDKSDRSESVVGQGADSILQVNTNSTIMFPKTMSTVSTLVSFSEDSETPVIGQENVTITFNSVETIRSNSTGETMEQASARLAAQLEALGYNHSAGRGQSLTLREQLRAIALSQ